MIPKIIHRVWLGNKTIPEVTSGNYWKEFETLYTGWKMRTWTGFHNPITDTLISELNNVGMASDIMRLEILYRYGGLYIDTDVQPLTPFPMILESFDCWAVKQSSGAANCIMGSQPGTKPVLWALRNILENRQRVLTLDKDLTMHVTGPDLISRAFVTCSDASLIERPLWSKHFVHHQHGAWL